MARQKRVDYSFGPGHGPVSGAVNAAGAVLGASMIADLAGVPPMWGVIGGVTAAAGAVLSVDRNGPGGVLAYRAGCWLCAGTWSTWAMWGDVAGLGHGPWSTNALAALAVGTIGAAFAGLGFRRAHRREEAERQKQVDAELGRLALESGTAVASSGDPDRIAAAWQAEIRRQSRRDVEVVGVEFWNPNTGFTLDLQLPADGTTIEDIRPYEKTLATALDVPQGCAVEVIDPGVGRRVVHVRVGTVDALAEDHHLPEGCEPNSIENDLSLGILSNRTEATVNVRYNNMVLVGQVDSGKSNQLNVITRQIVRCTDALVWAIDLTGNGRYPRPWARAWKEGRAEAPAIDWIAPDAGEALLMTTAAMAIIAGRTADYEQLMFDQGWDKIMVSPEIPEIVIITDEFGSLPPEVKDNLQQISDTGRGAGVRVISCALEATARYIPTALITQSRERIGMRVQDEAQLQYLFDRTWRSGRFDTSSMRVKGSGLFSTDAVPPEKFKGWRIEPGRIDVESIAVGPWRPELDEASIARCDTLTMDVKGPEGYRERCRTDRVYTGRWDRTLPVVFPSGGAGARKVGAPKQREKVTAAEAAREDGPTLGEAVANLEAARQRLAAVEPVPDPGPGESELPLSEPDWGLVESWLREGESSTTADGKAKPHPRVRMHQLVWDAGDAGIGPSAVHRALEGEGYGTTHQTVNGWMKADAGKGLLAQPGGDRQPYVRGPHMSNPHEGG